MKCPHCNYENNFKWPHEDTSEHGPFYELEITLKREWIEYCGSTHSFKELFGCPSCTKTFIH